MSMQTYKLCLCCSRTFTHKGSEVPAEIKTLFAKYSENGLTMTATWFHRFLVEVQKEDEATVEYAQAKIEEIRSCYNSVVLFYKSGLNLNCFFRFLFGNLNPPLDSPKHEVVSQRMTAPLSHYFIYTGHNSYLTGNQVSSDCSDVPIVHALRRSVRVIELDIWPNSSKDNVDVFHGALGGKTLTSPIELIRCLRSIKAHAFSESKYPVVITLEDHLTPDLQAKTAEMITQTFEQTLFTPNSTCCCKEFPSPESLKEHFMISTKPPKEYLESKAVREDSESTSKDSEEEVWGKEVPCLKPHTGSQEHIELDNGDDCEDSDDNDDDENSKSIDTTPSPECREYKHLIAIPAGKPKGSLVEALKVDPDKVRRLSLSEDQIKMAARHYGKDVVRFTKRNLLRIYPKGTRIDSSNYNPLIGWLYGAQMVAFNMQKCGRLLWLMQGMFRANNGCGYVKKPDFLLASDPDVEIFDPEVELPVKKTLKVKVIMGDGWYNEFKHTHFDKCSPPDFYVKIGIAGVTADTVMKKTESIKDNWIPVWNKEFEFDLRVPELALLRIEVHEYDMTRTDDFGGQTCLPVWELREGIRCVPLFNREGTKYKSVRLLMHFQFVN